jgi:ribokinase
MAGPSIGAARRPTILVVGAASRDLDPTDPRGWRLGGGVTYGSLAMARLGLGVRSLIGLDAQAETAAELDVLRAAGVEIEVVRLARGPVFDNIERPGGRLQVAHETSDGLPRSALPAAWRDSSAVLLNPVAGELGDEWATLFARATLVGLGWQGLFRRVAAGEPVAPTPLRRTPLVERADLATVSADDARAGGVPIDRLLRQGQELVVTHGGHGALHIAPGADGMVIRHLPALPVARVGDPTGAGDAFLATWVACVAAARAASTPTDTWPALAVAAAAASAKVEARNLTEMAGLRDLCDRLLRPPGAAPPSG